MGNFKDAKSHLVVVVKFETAVEFGKLSHGNDIFTNDSLQNKLQKMS